MLKRYFILGFSVGLLLVLLSATHTKMIPLADGFDFPVGKPNAKGYYNAQGFGKNNHLGDDWNGVGGGNTDFGDPVFAAAAGEVMESSQFFGGWGKVVIVRHRVQSAKGTKYYESLYGHLDSISVASGQQLSRGDQIGTIGNAEGIYLAHLHFEIRDSVGMDIGPGYSSITKGYLDPTKFIKANRPK